MPKPGITVYECEPDEARLFHALAPQFGIAPATTSAAVSETNASLARGNQCISVSHKTPITPSTLRALSQAGVAYISTRSSGYNHIDLDTAHSLGITVENVAYSPDSVADYTLMLMLMAVRNARSMLTRAAKHDFRLPDARGKELRDLTIGVIGTGRIGSAVIDRLRGFGCHIIAHDHHPKATAEYVPLDALLRRSDIITLHAPLTADTHHLLNHQRIARMKSGALVINTSRGPLIDTETLVAALERGQVGGAALDVLEGETGLFYADYRHKPIHNSALARLEKMPNVIITPHVAYYTDHALRDIIERTITNCLKFEEENAA